MKYPLLIICVLALALLYGQNVKLGLRGGISLSAGIETGLTLQYYLRR